MHTGTEVSVFIDFESFSSLLSVRSDSLVTQLQTFRALVRFTTRYPPLRTRFAISCNDKRQKSRTVANLWVREVDCNSNPEWHFYREFAASCVLGGEDITTRVEGVQPLMLGCPKADGLRVVEGLLFDCE